MEKISQHKTQTKNDVQCKTNQRVVVKGGHFKYHVITGEYFLTSKIDAYEEQDIMVLDVPNALNQTNIPPEKYGE